MEKVKKTYRIETFKEHNGKHYHHEVGKLLLFTREDGSEYFALDFYMFPNTGFRVREDGK